MKLTFFLLVIFWAGSVFAQNNRKHIELDTIHLRGYIYDEFGNSVKNLAISSRVVTNLNLPKGYHLADSDYSAITDTNGFFKIWCVSDDTLRLGSSLIYNTSITICIKGSRYIVVVLSHKKPEEIKLLNTIQFGAIHTHIKSKPQLKLEPDKKGSVSIFPEYLLGTAPKKGLKKFIDMLTSQIIYPQKAIDNNIQGEVKIGFVIAIDGSIVKPHILKGIGYGCEEEVINSLMKSPKWRPSLEYGKRVIAQEIITVNFKLTDK